MKHEWKKDEKHFYLPKNKPERLTVPEFRFFTIEGEGNPNDTLFSECIGVLYSLAYVIKMSPKKGMQPNGFYDYAVYPLEGIWDINEEAKKRYNGILNKDDLVFKAMIRQPDFVDEAYARKIIDMTKEKSLTAYWIK